MRSWQFISDLTHVFRRVTTVLSAVLLLMLTPITTAAADELAITAEEDSWPIAEVIYLSQAIPENATERAVASGQFDARFERAAASVPNIDGKDGKVWARVTITNTGADRVAAQLAFKYPQPNEIVFLARNEAGLIDRTQFGSAVANDGGAAGRFPNIPVVLDAGETTTIYIKLSMYGPILIPLQLATQETYAKSMALEYVLFALIAGAILAMAFNAFSGFLGTRQVAFGWFALYALGSSGFVLCATGLAKSVFWPGLAFDSNSLIFITQGIAVAGGAMFVATYLNTRTVAPRLHKLMITLAVAGVLSCFSLIMPDAMSQPLMFITVVIGQPILFLSTAYLAYQKAPGSRMLLVGWTATQAAAVWLYMRAFDIVPYTEINHFALPVASAFTALQFSWALSSRARQAEHNATHDTLTKLPNRLKLEMTTSSPRKIGAVLQIDLDGFKHINDTYGHSAGDHLLRTIASRIEGCGSARDQVFRTGGDEFIFLCDHRAAPETALRLARSIVEEAAKPVLYSGSTLVAGASVGMAFPNEEQDDISAIIERADAALYRAKRAGKGRVSLCNLAAERDLLGASLDRMAA